MGGNGGSAGNGNGSPVGLDGTVGAIAGDSGLAEGGAIFSQGTGLILGDQSTPGDPSTGDTFLMDSVLVGTGGTGGNGGNGGNGSNTPPVFFEFNNEGAGGAGGAGGNAGTGTPMVTARATTRLQASWSSATASRK